MGEVAEHFSALGAIDPRYAPDGGDSWIKCLLKGTLKLRRTFQEGPPTLNISIFLNLS